MLAILGYGVTGKSLKKYMEKRGIPHIVVDDNPGREKGVLTPQKAMELMDSISKLVLSPGIPMDHPLVMEAKRMGIEVEGEIEFTFKRMERPIPVVAITGTNGKTTTTHITGEILKASGKRVFVGGNIGRPFVDILIEEGEEPEVAVLELSSFQLEKTSTFRPHVAVLLNITHDHIGYHGSFDDYVESKMRIFANQKEEDWSILMDTAWKGLLRGKGKSIILGREIVIDEDRITINLGKPVVLERSWIKLPGLHNAINVAAACTASSIIGADKEAIIKTIEGFKGLPHRLEFVGEAHGVRFFNDSKATNIDAVMWALRSLDGPIILLMGGISKGEDLNGLIPEIKSKVKAVFLFGESGPQFEKALRGEVTATFCGKLEDAFWKAAESSLPGDTVLLSPGGSSFDEFNNYMERGNHFKNLAKEWIEKGSR